MKILGLYQYPGFQVNVLNMIFSCLDALEDFWRREKIRVFLAVNHSLVIYRLCRPLFSTISQ
ncbi:hypothetical protein ASPBRDRAFT_252764 [Aspergillus brasiliensis CBS 101740]|uniref:Uncharacterized protein n=1 Tax=Aspergillus brasiliensis (strain CBS 101740 / IMI 381727 / IBT 21946) TaxID=767769 RepID=A0A1L9V1X9_ASPBC|nr:hypothetical protein ASPBRDRAFT_252764 [Aspergillus brasiliensis CBS 101740]